MASWGRYAGQAVLYALFAAVIGYCSSSPQYRPLGEGQALLRLSFKHAGKLVADCRRRSADELARLPANMRSELDCPRERSAVRVRVELDGELLHDRTFPPAGLARDGAATGYWKLALDAGPHRMRVQVNDDVRAPGFTYEREAQLDVRAGQAVLIDINAERGGVQIR
jgi:hypothetical protein